MEINPQVVFDRLFGSGANPEQRAARRRESKSILDWVTGELNGLKQVIGPDDRPKLPAEPRGPQRVFMVFGSWLLGARHKYGM